MKRILIVVAMLASPLASAQYLVSAVRVNVAPPALKVEAVPVAPSPRHQWIAGYWAWRGGRHVWLGGHWALPPSAGYVWEPARWDRAGGGWSFCDGHWRNMATVQATTVYQPPPPPVVEEVADVQPPPPPQEVRPAPPFEGAVWVPGYWQWQGHQHVWVAGTWSAQPHGWRWEDHRWKKRDDGRWEHHEGHWHRGDDDRQ
jgi:hypothetical protein